MNSTADQPVATTIDRRNPQSGPRKLIFGLLALGLVLRLGVWSAFLGRPDAFVKTDTSSYLQPGLQLLESGSFPSYARTPVYPLFLAAASKTLSPEPALLALLQILLSLITLWLTFRLARRVYGGNAAAIGLGLLALDLTSAISANQLLTETLFALLLVGCLAALLQLHELTLRATQSGKLWIWAALAGGGFSVLTLCRPIGLLLFLPLAVWLCVARRTEHRRNVWPFALCFCACAAALPALWTYRNYRQTGTVFFTTISAADLYEYRAAWNTARLTGRPFEQVKDEFRRNAARIAADRGLNEGELADWEQTEGLRILRANPLLTLRQGLEGMIKMYWGISSADIDQFAAPQKTGTRTNTDPGFSRRVQSLLNETSLWALCIKGWAFVYLLFCYCGVLLALMQLLHRRRAVAQAPSPVQPGESKNSAGECSSRSGIDTRQTTSAARQTSMCWLLLLVLAYFTLLSCGAETYSRFRVPIAPLLSLLAGAGWIAIGGFLTRRTMLQHQKTD